MYAMPSQALLGGLSAFLEDVRTSVIDPAYADILANIRTLEELALPITKQKAA